MGMKSPTAGKVSVTAAQAPQASRPGPAGPTGPGPEKTAQTEAALASNPGGSSLSAAVSHLKTLG